MAIVLYGIVGLLSGSGSVLQSEVQDQWRTVGAGQAFALLGAVQAPLQLLGAGTIAYLLTKLPVLPIYVSCVVVLGLGAAALLALARRREARRVPVAS